MKLRYTVEKIIKQSEQEANLIANMIIEKAKTEAQDIIDKAKLDAKEINVEQIHQEMWDKSNALQAKWVKGIDDAIFNLNDAKADFYQNLKCWQQSIYPHDILPIANIFVEGTSILNVDKLIEKQMSKENADEELLKDLKEIDVKLSTYLKRFERAIHALDLYPFAPEKGCDFDVAQHMVKDDSIYVNGKKIEKCKVLGIAKKIKGGQDDVLVKAVVEVENE